MVHSFKNVEDGWKWAGFYGPNLDRKMSLVGRIGGFVLFVVYAMVYE